MMIILWFRQAMCDVTLSTWRTVLRFIELRLTSRMGRTYLGMSMFTSRMGRTYLGTSMFTSRMGRTYLGTSMFIYFVEQSAQ